MCSFESNLGNLKKPIEKELNELVTLAKWDNLSNYHKLKEYTEKSHRKLVKLRNQFKEILEQPAMQLFAVPSRDNDSLKSDTTQRYFYLSHIAHVLLSILHILHMYFYLSFTYCTCTSIYPSHIAHVLLSFLHILHMYFYLSFIYCTCTSIFPSHIAHVLLSILLHTAAHH
jgi:hypothetical protein